MLIRDKVYRAMQREVLVKHFDANETLFLERELTQLRAKMYEVAYPELVARTFVPKATDIAPSADTYSYKVLTPVGRGKFITYKSDDLPRVDLVGREVLGKVRPIGLSYGWDINELRESARMGVPLPELKARTARNATEFMIDEVLAFGGITDANAARPDVGLNGMVNNADVAGIGIAAGGWWLNPTPLTPALVLADLTAQVSAISAASGNLFKANAILLPTAHYNYVKQTPFSTQTGDSILTVFKKNNEEIQTIAPWNKLDTAGVAAKPRGIVYQKDPSILEGVIPQEFETMPPEWHGLELTVACHARVGGVKIYQPTAMRYIDFATS